MQILRKRIEPQSPVKSTPAIPMVPVSDPTPMDEDGVSLSSPTSSVPLPPLPEAQHEEERVEKQQEESQEQHQEERQEEQQQQQPPLPAGSEETMAPTEPPQESTAGKMIHTSIN